MLGTRVDPRSARIAVDGEPIRLESMVYYAVNKPKGYVSTNIDPAGRPRVVDLLPEIPERVYTVGRLDEDSTGLMILTNDGELANRLAHPRYGVEKLYRAWWRASRIARCWPSSPKASGSPTARFAPSERGSSDVRARPA